VRITLDTLRQGYSGIVLNFWASWCQSCGEEAKVLESAWEGARVQNILFVGIAVQDTPDHAKLHALELGKTYPIAWDDQNKVSVDFGVSGVPETFFVNKDGVIVAKHIGPLSADELKQYLHTLLTQAELYSSPVQE
jgi:cytochrome c biogenesis protein CcmG/thiol:disulfide interchange protein DsbE